MVLKLDQWLNIFPNLNAGVPPTSGSPAGSAPIVPDKAGRPKVNKADLLFTAELEQAIERCRTKVQAIAKECRKSNRKYRDPEFDCLEDADRCLHGLPTAQGPTYNPVEALRVTQIFDKPQFFVNGPTASDVAQGAIGDCWFVSALSVVATAGLVEKICVERDEQVGVYGFIFWRDAGWVDVIIDDLLFVQIPRWHDLSYRERKLYNDDIHIFRQDARKGSKALYFASSLEEQETWVPLLEKAYAKLHGDYAALSGGWTGEAVEDLTGGVISIVFTKDILDPDRFWTEELLNANVDRAFDCALSMTGGSWAFETLDGLVMNHAYSVIKAVEYNGKKFLRVRNPWGKHEWTGRWSDGSKEWTDEWLPALKALDYKFGNDGEFVMEYSDFLHTWDTLDRCRVFDDQWTTSQMWLIVNCGDYPSPVGFGDVSFKLNFSQDTQAVIALAQIDTRYFRGVESKFTFALSFTVFKSGEKEPVGSSPHNSFFNTCSRSVNLEIELPAGEYIVHVKIDRIQWKDPTLPVLDDGDGKTYYNVDDLPFHTKRKLGQKVTEKLYSSSIAANFNSGSYGAKMPLPPATFDGTDITSFEVETQRLVEKQNAERKEKFGTPKTNTSTAAATAPAPVVAAAAAAVTVVEIKTDDAAGTSTVVTAATSDAQVPAPAPAPTPVTTEVKKDDKIEKSSEDASGETHPVATVEKADKGAGGAGPAASVDDKGKGEAANKDEQVVDDAASVDPPKQPDWLKRAWEALNAKYPDDKVEFICRAISESSSPTDWMIKCLDCPGKIYNSGPGQNLDNFEIHLKNKTHRTHVEERVKASTSKTETPPADGATTDKPSHTRVCNGCSVTPIVGSVFHCLDVACLDYDLCEKCIKKNVHPSGHQLVEFTQPKDFTRLADTATGSVEDNSVVIGLRVYTKKECQVSIKGQLRHGNLVRGYLSSSKIL